MAQSTPPPARTGIEHIDHLLEHEAKTRTDEHGSEVRETFWMNGERYVFDYELDRSVWKEFDSAEDAWYYGNWVNKKERVIICYAEGDISYTKLADDEAFDKRVARMCETYEPTPEMTAIEADGKVTEVYQDRRQFFIDPEKCPPSKIRFDDADE